MIIPVFNSATSIESTLTSIAEQTFHNYEIVLVDGVSTDRTLAIITAFRELNPLVPVKLLSEPDRGIYDAMNKGIGLATGDWLYFMGADDFFFSPAVLGKIAAVIEKDQPDLIYGTVLGLASHKKYEYDTLDKVLSTGVHHQSVFYKAVLFKEIGGYDLNYEVAADYDLTLKVFLSDAYKKTFINEEVAFFGEAGLSAQKFDYKFFSRHYRILRELGGLSKMSDPAKCLDNSIYCCFFLAGKKEHLLFAWGNLLYYIIHATGLAFGSRVKALFRMAMWSLRP